MLKLNFISKPQPRYLRPYLTLKLPTMHSNTAVARQVGIGEPLRDNSPRIQYLETERSAGVSQPSPVATNQTETLINAVAGNVLLFLWFYPRYLMLQLNLRLQSPR